MRADACPASPSRRSTAGDPPAPGLGGPGRKASRSQWPELLLTQ